MLYHAQSFQRDPLARLALTLDAHGGGAALLEPATVVTLLGDDMLRQCSEARVRCIAAGGQCLQRVQQVGLEVPGEAESQPASFLTCSVEGVAE